MVAAAHIVGALVALMLLSTLLFFFGAWLDKLRAHRVMEQASLDLGASQSELSSPAFEQNLIRYFSAKYSDDLLKNRISDFIGLLLGVFSWSIFLLELTILGFVVWATVTEGQSNAIYAWLVLPIPIAASLVVLCAHFVCKLLTGRYPGQAKSARKVLTQSISQLSEPVT